MEEKKSLLQYFREEAGTYQRLAERVVKILGENGIYTIDILMSKTSNEIFAIKGIGDAAMHLIGKVMTKERAIRTKREEAYKKQCHSCVPTCLRDWFKKAGINYLEACAIEKILKNNKIRTVDEFLETGMSEFDLMRGIGKKRIEEIERTRELIKKKKSKN